MKIAITYQQNEASIAAYLIALIRARYPCSKLHKSKRHPPFTHVYLTIERHETPIDTRPIR